MICFPEIAIVKKMRWGHASIGHPFADNSFCFWAGSEAREAFISVCKEEGNLNSRELKPCELLEAVYPHKELVRFLVWVNTVENAVASEKMTYIPNVYDQIITLLSLIDVHPEYRVSLLITPRSEPELHYLCRK